MFSLAQGLLFIGNSANIRLFWKYRPILVYVFTNLSARAKCDTRSIFQRSLPGLNSEFFLLLDWLSYQG